MTQIHERPTATVDEREEIRAVEAPAPKYSPFVRWLGWLLITAMVAGGAWLIWDNFISSDETPAAVGTAPALVEIDPYTNPEVFMDRDLQISLDPHESPEIMRVPMAPSLGSIDLHENPEVVRIIR